MAISLPDARQLSDDLLEAAYALRALRGRELGFYGGRPRRLCSASLARTVCRWWSAYTTAGLEALPHERRTWTPPRLGSVPLRPAKALRIQQQPLDDHSPEDLGIPSPLVDPPRRRRPDSPGVGHPPGGPDRGRSTSNAGATRPRSRPVTPGIKTPKKSANGWRKPIRVSKSGPRRKGRDIFWCDETGSQADQHPGCGYAREGEPATMEEVATNSHIRCNQISAISNAGAIRFMTYTSTMTAALFIVFLGKLAAWAGQKIFLIADRLKAHDAKAVDEWVAEHRDRIELFYLPRYSPERNPDEYLNNDLKGGREQDRLAAQSGRPAFTHPSLHAQAVAFTRACPEDYFQHPSAQYAAGL